ncbi:hypothetical protein [Sporichthya sp.]|uniref:hypothetical protein n=1 Tax=Sporichthya sp. TaxID=65475 RepID=UPI001817CA19|nr:hypothetical protein [Sporichthya sp.]MBA3744877.1 hypothetical protein [Sporichthya sp.]
MTEAWTETVDPVEETVDECTDGAADDIPSSDTADDIPGDLPTDEAGIPDEPEAFVEELRAAGDLPETGDPRVDQVLAGLAGIGELPIAEHVGVYDQAHRGLQDALANLDQG